MSELAQELYDGLDAIVAARVQHVGPQVVAEWDDRLWEDLSAQGFASIDAADPDVGLAEHLALARAVGARALGLPLVEIGLAGWVATVVGLKLPDGLVLPALATQDQLTGELDGGELVVSGRLRRVPWGRRADHVVALAATPDGPLVVVVPAVAEREGANLAAEPRDDLVVDAARVIAPHAVPLHPLTIDEIHLRGALLRASQAAGAMERILALVVEYAGQREQFGAPIASFQAVQQHLVAVAAGAAATRAGVESVVRTAPDHRLVAAASAKVTADLHATTLARSAHQVFGAIGVTQEHELHLLTRRLWSWQDEFGDAARWSRHLAERLTFPGGPGLWAVLTPPHPALADRSVGESVRW